MMKKIGAAGVFFLLVAVGTGARAAPVEFGAYLWNQNLDGEVADEGLEFSLNHDLNLKEEDGASVYLLLEHDIPVLPNLLLQDTQLEFNAKGRIALLPGQEVESFLNLDHTDATLYYRPLKDPLLLKLGLTVRAYNAEISLEADSAQYERQDQGATLMLYAGFSIPLPEPGLSFGGSANHLLEENGEELLDYQLSLDYLVQENVVVHLGYRAFLLTLESEDSKLDLDIDGFYLGVGYQF